MMNQADAQMIAQNELQSGESLLWTGVPDPARASRAALLPALFGIPFAGFALFWIAGAYRGAHIASRGNSVFGFFPLFGLPFLLIGLAIVFSPLWAYLRALSTVYAVTNQRVLIISGTRNRSVKSCTPADIGSIEHQERPDGSGDIIINTQALLRRNNMVTPVKVFLYGVPNVRSVAAQVMALHKQPVPA